jgi:cell division transport system permease protein
MQWDKIAFFAPMKKRSLGQTSSWSVVFTVALALFNLGLFGIIVISGNQLASIIRQNFEVEIFLTQDIDINQQKEVQKILALKPYAAKTTEGKSSLKFISKEEAGKKFMLETGEDFSEFLGQNPLRDAFIIKINQDYLYPEKMKDVKKDIQSIPGVFEVVYVESLIGSIQENLGKVSILFSIISGLLLIVVIWLIRNTVRLAIYAQRFLIRSMVLVGAEPWFIQRPYVWNMLKQGFGGGLLASIFLLVGVHFASEYYPPLKQVFAPEQIGLLIIGLQLSGIIIGSVSSYFSVRNFLRKRLDDLHIY